VNPKINAVVKDRFDEARKEADEADRKRKSSRGKNLPPYHGVPCTIKEAYAMKGMPQTAGLVARKGNISAEDATAVGGGGGARGGRGGGRPPPPAGGGGGGG
jgi:fatty acid amide hydrolase 2